MKQYQILTNKFYCKFFNFIFQYFIKNPMFSITFNSKTHSWTCPNDKGRTEFVYTIVKVNYYLIFYFIIFFLFEKF